ncbi:MAG: hypothetical protein IJM55_07580 [Ruminococcus sp.]|nr:hypothetical protein [Ruminococcus sp.]
MNEQMQNYPNQNGNYMQGPPQQPKPTSGCCIASLILGIIAILSSCCFYFVSIPCAVLGIILAAVGIKSGKGGKGMGIAGLILCIISISIVFLTQLICIVSPRRSSSEIFIMQT